jgi:hypothetical protein
MNKLEGKIIAILEPQKVTETFTKREIVVDIPGQMPCPVPVQFSNSRLSMVDGLQVGNNVEVEFFLRGSQAKEGDNAGKYFVNLEGYSVKVTG